MDHHRKGILALIGSAASIFFAGAFVFGFPGVMGPYWQELFQAGRGAIGLTLFFVLAAVGSFMFLVGRLQEKFGSRPMITLGTIICGLDILLVAYASKLSTLYLWAFIMGMGTCFIYIPTLTVVQRWFPERRGLVSGLVNFTFGFSAALMSPIFNLMFKSVGYTPMCIILSAAALVVGVISAQFTVLPETASPSESKKSNGAPTTEPMTSSSLTVRESLRTRSFRIFWLVWALQGAAGIAMVTLSTQFGLSLGLGLGTAVVILTAFNITSGLSRLLMGLISDMINRNLAMSVTFLAAGLAYFILPHTGGIVGPAALAAVIGVAFGTLFTVSAPLAVDCFGLLHFGSIYGIIFTAYGFVAGPLGPWLSGYVLDATNGNFTAVFSYLGAFCIIAGVLIHFVVPPRRLGFAA